MLWSPEDLVCCRAGGWMKWEEIARNSFALRVVSHLKRCDATTGCAALPFWGSWSWLVGCFQRVRGELPVIHLQRHQNCSFSVSHCMAFKLHLKKCVWPSLCNCTSVVVVFVLRLDFIYYLFFSFRSFCWPLFFKLKIFFCRCKTLLYQSIQKEKDKIMERR